MHSKRYLALEHHWCKIHQWHSSLKEGRKKKIITTKMIHRPQEVRISSILTIKSINFWAPIVYDIDDILILLSPLFVVNPKAKRAKNLENSADFELAVEHFQILFVLFQHRRGGLLPSMMMLVSLVVGRTAGLSVMGLIVSTSLWTATSPAGWWWRGDHGLHLTDKSLPKWHPGRCSCGRHRHYGSNLKVSCRHIRLLPKVLCCKECFARIRGVSNLLRPQKKWWPFLFFSTTCVSVQIILYQCYLFSLVKTANGLVTHANWTD